MSEFPSSQSSTAESIALIQSIRSLKQSATDRATAFGIISSIASDTAGDAGRNMQGLAQVTKDSLELARGLGAKADIFEDTVLEVFSKMANANALITEQAAKMSSRL
jgi:hypothetical protein